MLYQDGLALSPNTAYILTFVAHSTTGSDLAFYIEKADSSSEPVAQGVPDLSNTWRVFSVPFQTGSDASDLRLRFQFGGLAAAGDVYWIDRVSIVPAYQ